MPNRCVRCGKIYENTSDVILKGCTCGSHYFFFFKEDDLRLKEQTESLTAREREEILEDVKEMVGEEPESPVILDLESIRVKKAGKFEIDLVNLFKRRPVVYKLEDGKYLIDIPSTFQLMKHKEGNVENEIREEIDVELEEREKKEDMHENKKFLAHPKPDEVLGEKEKQEKSHKKEDKKEKIKEEYVKIPKDLKEEAEVEEEMEKEIKVEDLEKQDNIKEKIKEEI